MKTSKIFLAAFGAALTAGLQAVGIRKSGILFNAMINDNDGWCREGYLSFTEGYPKDSDNFLAVDFE